MSWRNVVGHEAVIRLMKGQLTQGRLPQSTLFVGLPGIGKRTLALELAKAVQCEAPAPGGEPCEICEACLKIANGSFPDVMQISPESETGQMGIDQIRNLSHWLSLTPYQGRWKVGLVEEADRLTDQAAHACLKLLEEPPAQSLLILMAQAVHRLPPTLISRCHLVRCFPQGIERVASYLQEKERLDPELSRILAVCSGGRLGLAVEFHRKQRLPAKNGALNQLLTAWKEKALEVPLGRTSRREVEEAIDWWAAWWRDLLVLSVGGNPDWVIHQDRIEDLREIIARIPSPVRPEQAVRPSTQLRTNGASKGEGGVGIETLLDRIDRAYWVQAAVQANASPRIALAALLSR